MKKYISQILCISFFSLTAMATEGTPKPREAYEELGWKKEILLAAPLPESSDSSTKNHRKSDITKTREILLRQTTSDLQIHFVRTERKEENPRSLFGFVTKHANFEIYSSDPLFKDPSFLNMMCVRGSFSDDVHPGVHSKEMPDATLNDRFLLVGENKDEGEQYFLSMYLMILGSTFKMPESVLKDLLCEGSITDFETVKTDFAKLLERTKNEASRTLELVRNMEKAPTTSNSQ